MESREEIFANSPSRQRQVRARKEPRTRLLRGFDSILVCLNTPHEQGLAQPARPRRPITRRKRANIFHPLICHPRNGGDSRAD